jgi:branched-chain amino acid transport system substrate-binding protein
MTVRENRRQRSMRRTLVRSRRLCARVCVAVGLVTLVSVLCAAAGMASANRTSRTTTINLFSIEALTGPSAATGVATTLGEKLAIKEINGAGGFKDSKGHRYKLRLTTHDLGANKTDAIALFRQAASSHSVLAVVGSTSSVGYLPMVPVAAQLQMPLIGTGSAAPVQKWNPWTDRVGTVSARALPFFLKTLKSKLPAMSRVAILYDQTQDSQVGEEALVKKLAPTYHYQVVSDLAFKSGDLDFSSQVSAIQAANPDLVYVAGQPGDLGNIVMQLRHGNVNAPLATGFSDFIYQNVWDTSQGLVKGGYTWIAVDLASSAAPIKAFVAKYNQTYNQSANVGSIFGYTAIYSIVQAVKKAKTGTDRAKFIEAMNHIKVKTPLGSTVQFKNPPSGDNQGATVSVLETTGPAQYQTIASLG